MNLKVAEDRAGYKCPDQLVLYIGSEEKRQAGLALADQLGIGISEEGPDPDRRGLMLVYDDRGLSLTDGRLSMQGDFANPKTLSRIRQGVVQKELLVKAAKVKNHTGVRRAIDATAGMGEDALLLAAAGFEVTLYEYNLVIAALLQDCLERCKDHPQLGPLVGRMQLIAGDSITLLRQKGLPAPDVILLDPMFPERNKSALIKKKFQLLQQLEAPCGNEEDLLAAALEVGPHKLVIKRPLKGPWLADRKPDYSISGKAIRYDCIVNAPK